MNPERTLRTAIAAATLLATGHAMAAHPFLTEDPGTLGTGKMQVELGLAAGSADPAVGGNAALFSPQLSIGVTPTLDLIGQGVWTRQTQSGGPTLYGGGDVLADFKWRFFENDDYALAVRAGLDLPAGDPDIGFGTGGVGAHVLAIVGVTRDTWAFYGNAGYARAHGSGTRNNLGVFSAAFTYTDLAPWQAFVEVAAYSNPDPAQRQWPAIARTGLIYTVNPSLDLDIGFQARLNPSAPRAVLLAGATIRW
ncbi:MAG: hypothetical protein U1F10_01365 [Burkholderiales bacterium]